MRELDHKLVLNVFSIADKKTAYHNIDARASDPIAFRRTGNAIVYTVREKGVDNLWKQPLDGSAFRQLTHFTSERIVRFAFSPDGSQIAIERAHTESDAVLLRDTTISSRNRRHQNYTKIHFRVAPVGLEFWPGEVFALALAK